MAAGSAGTGNSGGGADGTGSGSTGTGTGTGSASLDEGSGGGTNGFGPVIVSCGDVPLSAVGADYLFEPSAVGGDEDFSWAAEGLPDGLEIDEDNGEISGVPTLAGDVEIIVTATDGEGKDGSSTCVLTVNEGLGTVQPDGPKADEACVTGSGSLLDLIVEGTGDGSPIICTILSGTGNGRSPDGITVDPDTCEMAGALESDRFGVHAFMVEGEQNGVSVYAPYCPTQDDSANTYAVDADHSGVTSNPLRPLVGFFDPTGPFQIGGAGDPEFRAVDASVCSGSNSCYFGYTYGLNSSPFDSDTFDIIDSQLLSDASPDPIGLTHGLTVAGDGVSTAFQMRPWIQSVTMRYCLGTDPADCDGSEAILANGGGQLEVSIVMFPQP